MENSIIGGGKDVNSIIQKKIFFSLYQYQTTFWGHINIFFKIFHNFGQNRGGDLRIGLSSILNISTYTYLHLYQKFKKLTKSNPHVFY